MKGGGMVPPFLGVENRKTALFHVLPAPYGRTVSWGRGTERAPREILLASAQVELLEDETDPVEAGVYTHGETVDPEATPSQAFQRVRSAVAQVLAEGNIPVLLGGEHTLSAAAAAAVSDNVKECGVVILDAHMDMRDEYEGERLSHACTARRITETGMEIFQVGIRSFSKEERNVQQDRRFVSADRIRREGTSAAAPPEWLPSNVYLSIDVDVFDPSLMPATGTPEPGGLDWYEVMDILRTLCNERKIIGFDVVELAPIEGMLHPQFTAAKMVYEIMKMIHAQRKGLVP